MLIPHGEEKGFMVGRFRLGLLKCNMHQLSLLCDTQAALHNSPSSKSGKFPANIPISAIFPRFSWIHVFHHLHDHNRSARSVCLFSRRGFLFFNLFIFPSPLAVRVFAPDSDPRVPGPDLCEQDFRQAECGGSAALQFPFLQGHRLVS